MTILSSYFSVNLGLVCFGRRGRSCFQKLPAGTRALPHRVTAARGDEIYISTVVDNRRISSRWYFSSRSLDAAPFGFTRARTPSHVSNVHEFTRILWLLCGCPGDSRRQ